MTVHLISVGINLLERFFADPSALQHHSEAGVAAAEAIHQSQPAGLLTRLVDRDTEAASGHLDAWFGATPVVPPSVRELVAQVRPELWPATASAELDTFARAASTRVIAADDLAVLVASDTVSGLTAAIWNAAALTGAALDRVAYLTTPQASPAGPRGRALVVRTAGLDASSAQGFRTAMAGLGQLAHSLLHSVTRPGERFCFYLSGGFKAAIPYLIGLAEGLRSLPPDSRELNAPGAVDAYVLHDSADAWQGPIRLPLRRMPPELVQSELAGFDTAGRRGTKPRSDLLDGYLYEQVDSHWELTGFGHGMRALFPRRPEILGG